MKFGDFVAFLLLIVILGGAVYAFFYVFPFLKEANQGTFVSNQGATPEMLQNLTLESEQFYPNLRYQDKNIKYSISDSCDAKKRKSAEDAFSVISELTILNFEEDKANPEIAILCSDIAPSADEKNHFVAGEGGPSKIIDTGNFEVILFGKVSLYRTDVCEEPKVAEHEILHALGFDHNSNRDSILYPITDCKQQIDQDIIEDINRLYSVPSLPDLVIDEVSAERTGKYIGFKINISNKGLIDSNDAILYVYSSDKEIYNYLLSDMGMGKRKVLTITNLFSISASDMLRFEIKTPENEISKDNNIADISLGSR
jgi:hypothetical protein